jgi:hypothetical protein
VDFQREDQCILFSHFGQLLLGFGFALDSPLVDDKDLPLGWIRQLHRGYELPQIREIKEFELWIVSYPIGLSERDIDSAQLGHCYPLRRLFEES